MVDFTGLFKRAGEAFGVSPAWLDRVAKLESNYNPQAKNPYSSASGLFQFTKGTGKQYGLTNPFDPNASAMAAANLASDNRNYLQQKLGRQPEGWELYLAHQQGAGGAAALLGNPNARAVDVVGRDAVVNNAGDENMTAREFAGLWQSKFGGESAGAAIAGQAEGDGAEGMTVGTGNFISDWLVRATIIVLGFIFVAVGLGMFKPAVLNVLPGGAAVKGAVKAVT